MKTFYIQSQTAFTSAELDVIASIGGTTRSLGGKGKMVSIVLDPERLEDMRTQMSRLNPTCEIKTTFSLCQIPEDEESVHEDNTFKPATVRSLTDPSEYIGDRPRVPLELFEHLHFYKVSTSASSPDVLELYRMFLLLSRVSPEVVIIARTPSDVQALYGFSRTETPDKARRRLVFRKRSCATRNPRFGSIEVHMKFVSDRKDIVSFIQNFYREIVCTEGVEMEAIAEIAHARSPHVPSNLTVNTRKTAEEIDEEGRCKIVHFVQKINEAVPVEEQVRLNFKLDEDTINDLVVNRVFMMSDRTFLRANRRHIQNLIDKNIRDFREAEPAEAKAKRLKTVQDGRRALAESFAQKIREYCAEHLEDNGFCSLKNAYTHKILRNLADDELITDDDFIEARTVKDEIDELLAESRTENEENNKGDLAKAKQLARRILEIFLFELKMDQIDFTNELTRKPRQFIREFLFESEHVNFGASQLQLFNGVHHDMIMEKIRSDFAKIQKAADEFKRAEQVRRYSEVEEDPERESFEASQRAQQTLNDELTAFLTTLDANDAEAIKRFGNVKCMYDSKGLITSTRGRTPEQIEIVRERERLDEQFRQLRIRYKVKTVEELRSKILAIKPYVCNLSTFTPSTREVREYLYEHFEEIFRDN